MADIPVGFTVPDAKVAIATEGFLKIYPNVETMVDPDWVDPEDGSEVAQIPKYTTKQWVNEKMRRLFVRDVRRGLQMIDNEDSIIEEDEGMATI